MSDIQETSNKQQATSQTRPPVVVVLGHVDHGKTTILDSIRKTKVAEGEAGGITQHIGAYQIVHQDRKITFLDTPGHEAFSAIRSRGARVADIAILVVAADEGLKPQTKEAIAIIKEAKIPFVVAINKIDKEGANPQRVRQELAEAEVQVEDYGGNIPVAEVSAKKGEGLDHLLELVLLTAELEELTFDPNSLAKGVVIESHLDPRRGIVATLLVHNGTLKLNDFVVAGQVYGKLKSLNDFNGKPTTQAIGSDPVVAIGWEEAPKVGAKFVAVTSLEEAKNQALAQSSLGPVNVFVRETVVPIEPGAAKVNKRNLNLIIKADVASSLEAIDQVLKTIHSEEVDYRVTGYGVGHIGDGDIKNAIATKSVIVGFHVVADDNIKTVAEREGITIKTFTIIYEFVEFVRLAMSELLEPEIRRVPLGKLKILAVFKKEAKYQIVGGRVASGKMVRGALADVVRGSSTLTAGRIGQLQAGKKDVSEVAEGLECGIRFDMLGAVKDVPVIIKEGDVLDVYSEEKIKRSI